MTLTESFARLLASLRYEDLPVSALQAARERCIDYLGSLAGGVNGEVARLVRDQTVATGALRESTVLGTTCRTSRAQAALLNGIAGHTLELDDGDRRAYGHPAVVAFSTAFPVAEALHTSGRDFLTAVAAGYEVYARIGQAANPGAVQRGYHTTGVAGALEAAVTAAKLLGGSEKLLLDALTIASLCSSGLSFTFRKANPLKAFTAGRAAFNGVTAAEMAAMGIDGADDVLEGKGGWFQAYSGQEPSVDILLAPMQPPFAVEGSYIKFYPSCRYTHAPIDAALALREGLSLDEIDRIIITTYPTAVYLATQKDMPADGSSSRFNIGFAVAVALVKGRVGLGDLDPAQSDDPMIETLFHRISFVEDAAWDCPDRNIRGAAMDIVLASGRTLHKEVPLPVGEPENPAPARKYREKFLNLSAGVWSPARQEEILAVIARLEELPDICELVNLLETDR